MPTIEVSHKDMCRLVGRNIPLKTLQENDILYAKGEVETVKGDLLKIDIKDTNRPDLWSAEGIAREIKGRYASSGLPLYTVKKSSVRVHVDSKVRKVRPKTVAAVVRGLRLTKDALSQMIQLQEKVALTFGRNRREVAIGVYDLDRISPPIRYTTVKPDGIRFVPLDFDKPLTPKQILEQHPKGREFGHLLEGKKEYPIFLDANNKVLSVPPIINSADSGRVSKGTKDVFIECSGFDFRFLVPSLNAVVVALADRGGSIESVEVSYPGKTIFTPDLRPKKAKIEIEYINKISGLSLTSHEMLKLLKKARYSPSLKGRSIEVLYPAYRQDIMHPRDIVEDVLISYGYNRIEPLPPKLATTGSSSELARRTETISDIMIGLGLQEVMTYILTSKDSLFQKMNLPDQQAVEIENPISMNWNVFRNWLLPNLLDFLSKNKHVDYPQRIFEIGDCILPDPRRETRSQDKREVAVAITDVAVHYEGVSSLLDAFLTSLGVSYSLQPTTHPSFLKGRVAEIVVKGKGRGMVGEINPKVLQSWGLEKPVAAFEIDLSVLQT